jgi:hypothetical protein
MKKKIGWSRKFGSRLTRMATIVKKKVGHNCQLSVGLSYRISFINYSKSNKSVFPLFVNFNLIRQTYFLFNCYT